MAKVSGIVKIEGTVEDLTFYKRNGRNFVRRKGGIARERIESDPNFVRTRENNSEFRHNCESGKLLRMSLGSLVFKAKDANLSNRLMQSMSRIKNLDTTSARGKRRVEIGITSPEGKQVLRSFDFNANAPLQNVLFTPHALNILTGEIRLTGLVPAEQLLFPQGATHASFQSAVLALDFETGDSELAFSPVRNLPLNLTPATVSLVPSDVPTTTGVQLFLLVISFYQEINGVQYSLKNEEYNVLNIVEVV